MNLLNRVRIGIPTSEDLQLLQTRVVGGNNTSVNLDSPSFDNALHIYPTNKQCAQYNEECLQNLLTTTQQPEIHLNGTND